MSRRWSVIWIAVVVVVVAALAWVGGGLLWQRLLALHGKH